VEVTGWLYSGQQPRTKGPRQFGIRGYIFLHPCMDDACPVASVTSEQPPRVPDSECPATNNVLAPLPALAPAPQPAVSSSAFSTRRHLEPPKISEPSAQGYNALCRAGLSFAFESLLCALPPACVPTCRIAPRLHTHL